MKFLALVAALAATTTAQVVSSKLLVKNFCTYSVWVLLSSPSASKGPEEIKSGVATISNIVGVGNQLGITKTSNYYSPETPKFVVGTSTDKGILYWTVSSLDGDPFPSEQWNVTSSGTRDDVCQHASTYDGQVHACQDQGQLLTVNLCT